MDYFIAYFIGLVIGIWSYHYTRAVPREKLLKEKISKLEFKNFKLARRIINEGMKDDAKA